MSALPLLNHSMRDADQMLERALAQWGGDEDLWIFGYGSLIWRPEFDFSERRSAHVHGWHRALKMWSTINRGTPQVPGLVFGMLSGGSCQGMAFRIPRNQGDTVMRKLWLREMPNAVYDPRWLPCRTPHGAVKALAFTRSRAKARITPASWRRTNTGASSRRPRAYMARRWTTHRPLSRSCNDWASTTRHSSACWPTQISNKAVARLLLLFET